MHAIRYIFAEGLASLGRSRAAALLAVMTIAAGVFILGFFLVVNANLQGVVSRWSEAAELSVFLADEVTPEALRDIDALAERSGLVRTRRYISRDDALRQFREEFPDLAGTAGGLERNPFPASFEFGLRPEHRDAATAVDAFVAALSAMPGVIDVRYDREWLGRLQAVILGARIAGIVIVGMLALAAAMTVANVVGLAAVARRDEIEIMQLVGAPFTYVRGPFVAEGILQGGLGAAMALAGLAGMYFLARPRILAAWSGTFEIVFLPLPVVLLLLLSGMAVGCLGGYAVARRVR